MNLRNTKTIILNEGDTTEKREEIRQYFHATYSLDEQLYETLASESAFYVRAEPLRHPLIFYLGHTATFYINKLIVAKLTNQRINPRFKTMFAGGRRRDHPDHAPHAAHPQGTLFLGNSDGHRASADPHRDVTGHHSSPAK